MTNFKLPIVRTPVQLSTNDIVSVQPMIAPHSQIFYMHYVNGSVQRQQQKNNRDIWKELEDKLNDATTK